MTTTSKHWSRSDERSLAAAGVETFVWRPSDWDEIAAVLGHRRKES